MRITNLPLLRSVLALVVLGLLSGAFAVATVRGSDGAESAPGTAESAAEATSPTNPLAGVQAGGVAGQAQISSPGAALTAAARAEAQAGSSLAVAMRAAAVDRASADSPDADEAAPASTVPDEADSTTSTAAEAEAPEASETTSTTVAETTTTTAPPETTTTVPETTTTTVAETTTTTAPEVPSGVVLSEGEARDIFGLYFAAEDVEKALSVARCESGLNTAAYNPAGYAGLFQHAIAYWDDRAASAGWAGASVYDAHANSAVAAWLVSQSGWSPWPNC